MAEARLVDAEAVAEALGLKKQTVYLKARRGEIPCHRFGSTVRFDLEEVLEASKDAHENGAAEE